jgi:hypothetical protein
MSFWITRGTGRCLECASGRIGQAMRTPAARRWLASWQDRMARAMEVAAVPSDAKVFKD